MRFSEQSKRELKQKADIVAIVSQFTKLRKDGAEHVGLCIFHDDREHPSLCVSPGNGLWKCHACGVGGDVFRFVELAKQFDFPTAVRWVAAETGFEVEEERSARVQPIPSQPPEPKLVASWRYEDKHGVHVTTIERWEPGKQGRSKQYAQKLPGGVYRAAKRKVPYRAPQLVADVLAGKTIFIVEGEKCVDVLRGLDDPLSATCWPGGAGNVGTALEDPDFAEHFRDADVVLMPDNDEPGRVAMGQMRTALLPVARTVRTVDLGKLRLVDKVGDDVADYFTQERGGLEHWRVRKLLQHARIAEVDTLGGEGEGLEEDDGLPNTDLGNADRFVRQHSKMLRYNTASGRWIIYSDGLWHDDRMQRALDLTGATAMAIRDKKWSTASQSYRARKAMLSLAAARPGAGVNPEQFDADPWALSCRNGLLDLRTGEIRAHRREDWCTKRVRANYVPAATAPTFQAFLEQALPDPATRAFVQRLFGYALTGVVKEHVLPVFAGSGGNGKGTLCETLMSVCGNYARQVGADVVMSADKDKHPADRAQLMGCRLVVMSEPEDRGLSEGTVKSLTGGDRINARFMGKDFFEFTPSHKIILQTNQKPHVKGTDNGIWRRLRIIPFTRSFVGKEDVHLKDKLLAEADGILAWAVRGCLDWQALGLGSSPEIDEGTAVYRSEQDAVGNFLAECAYAAAGETASAADLWQAWQRWCTRCGEQPRSQRYLGAQMTARGHTRRQDKFGRVGYLGIRLSKRDANPEFIPEEEIS